MYSSAEYNDIYTNLTVEMPAISSHKFPEQFTR